MALIQVNYMSQALWRTVTLQVILPADKADVQGNLLPLKKYKTLYLLNGLHGNYTDWVSGTRIKRWAQERDLAVVMPAGDNSFYVDREAQHNNYGDFVGRELVEITRRMFPLSDRREDTYIGGLSMGGYGAIINGLKYRDTFGAIVGLSSALHMFDNIEELGPLNWQFGETLFGPIGEAVKSDNNPRVLVEKIGGLKKEKPDLLLPKIYMACGTEDFLLESNREFRALFEKHGFDLTYTEGPGNHNWDFWDEYIKKALDWLPLDAANSGMDSGNIAVKEI